MQGRHVGPGPARDRSGQTHACVCARQRGAHTHTALTHSRVRARARCGHRDLIRLAHSSNVCVPRYKKSTQTGPSTRTHTRAACAARSRTHTLDQYTSAAAAAAATPRVTCQPTEPGAVCNLQHPIQALSVVVVLSSCALGSTGNKAIEFCVNGTDK